jgi:hypothetical protein
MFNFFQKADEIFKAALLLSPALLYVTLVAYVVAYEALELLGVI